MVNELVSILASGSTAVYVTVVSPMEKVSPELWLAVSVTIPELSLAVGGVQVTTAVATPESVDWVMSEGVLEMTGFSLSEISS